MVQIMIRTFLSSNFTRKPHVLPLPRVGLLREEEEKGCILHPRVAPWKDLCINSLPAFCKAPGRTLAAMEIVPCHHSDVRSLPTTQWQQKARKPARSRDPGKAAQGGAWLNLEREMSFDQDPQYNRWQVPWAGGVGEDVLGKFTSSVSLDNKARGWVGKR